MESFRKLGIIQPVLRAIEEEGFKEPSSIQEKTIPLVLAGKDVIAGSATGSGKTLVFGAGIIQNTERGAGIQSLVMVPTRELARQVSKMLGVFSKYNPLNIACIYGGDSIEPQIQKLRGADIAVGTPGRILDHLKRKTLNLGRVKILILDEADRMLDMGFIDDVESIIIQCPRERQTLLFSATITYDVAMLAKRYMKDPVRVSVDELVDPAKLAQVYYDADDMTKFSLLVHLLKHEKAGLVMVFCNTRTNTDFVANNLKINGLNALAIHGGFSQEKRNRTMESFHAKSVQVLVCTDVAARGLDIKGISHVYNYDIPKDRNDYIHRIGRTARAGKDGKVINILTPMDWDSYRRITMGSEWNIEKAQTPYLSRAIIGWKQERKGFRSFRGGRPFHKGRPSHRPRYGGGRR